MRHSTWLLCSNRWTTRFGILSSGQFLGAVCPPPLRFPPSFARVRTAHACVRVFLHGWILDEGDHGQRCTSRPFGRGSVSVAPQVGVLSAGPVHSAARCPRVAGFVLCAIKGLDVQELVSCSRFSCQGLRRVRVTVPRDEAAKFP